METNLFTLEDLNARIAAKSVYESGKYTLKREFAVIGWDKTHIGIIETVIEDREPRKGTYKVGQVYSASPFCNGNGQHKGRGPRRELTTADVTCIKCLKNLTK